MNEYTWFLSSVGVTLLSMAITGLIIPQILLIAFRRQLFDGIDARKIHHGSVPRLGGFAFMPSLILALAFVVGTGLAIEGGSMQIILFTSHPVIICYALCSLMLLYLVGLADDLIGVKYRAKLVVQIIAASLMVISGLWINNIGGFAGIYSLPSAAGIPLTIVVVVFIINAINLIDGIDGLASGLSIIALLCYGVMYFMLSHYVLAMLAFATLGTLVPFFFFNVMGDAIKKKKIFMGDTGTMTIGFMLAFMSVEMSVSATHRVVNTPAIVMAYAPLILPCFDVVRVFFHRIRMHQNPFLPDRSHIHHKFLALGINQHVVLVLILLLSLFYAAVSVWMSRYISVTAVLAIDFGSWVLFNMYLTKRIYRRQKQQQSLEHQYV